MNFQKILILLISIGIIVLGIAYYKLNETNKNLMESKNFNFEWSPSEEILFSFWKNNEKLSSENIDRNFDNNFELFNAYDVYGNLVQSSYDNNENGIFEKYMIFNSNGQNVGNNIDSDEDGAIDEFLLVLDNKNELKFLDTDNDGRYEKVVILDKKANVKSEKLIEELFEKN